MYLIPSLVPLLLLPPSPTAGTGDLGQQSRWVDDTRNKEAAVNVGHQGSHQAGLTEYSLEPQGRHANNQQEHLGLILSFPGYTFLRVHRRYTLREGLGASRSVRVSGLSV